MCGALPAAPKLCLERGDSGGFPKERERFQPRLAAGMPSIALLFYLCAKPMLTDMQAFRIEIPIIVT